MPVLFLAFALAYHSQRKWLTRQYLPFFVVPLITLFLAWTNSGNLFRKQVALDSSNLIPTLAIEPGPWYWIHIVYFLLLLLISTLLLGQIWLRTPHHREKSVIVLLGAIIPWIGSGLFIVGFVSIDLTSIAFTVMGLLLGWGLFRLQLFDLAPMARRAM